MGNNRKKWQFAANRERRLSKLLGTGEVLTRTVPIPAGAIRADLSQHVPNNSYSPPPSYYIDVHFTCCDCHCEAVWTAQQQKWYFEVAKGSLYARAVRCGECRRKRRENRGQGDPNPIKHLGTVMKRIRLKVDPFLIAAGFQYGGKFQNIESRSIWLEYSCPGLSLHCQFVGPSRTLKAETMDENGECLVVASVPLGSSQTSSGLIERIDEFALAVQQFAASLL